MIDYVLYNGMHKMLLIFLITLHVLADFYLQTDKMAKAKLQSYIHLCKHSILYAITFLGGLIFIQVNIKLMLVLASAAVAHFIIDSLKFIINKVNYFNRITKESAIIFLVDQILHILSILIIVLLFENNNIELSIYPLWGNILYILNINVVIAIKWILVILLIMEPANIVFRLLFSSYKPECEDDARIDERNKKAGAIIGCLERILIVIFVSINQFSALGFILTAKSIARYDEITKNRLFSEYYLIGTLVSVVYSIIVYGAIF